MIHARTARNAQLSFGSIFLGGLIGVGALIPLGALGGALAVTSSFVDEKAAGSDSALILGALGGFFLITASFFIAGYITARLAHQAFRFDAIMHSLAAWALMSLLALVLASIVTTANAVRHWQGPTIVTDLRLKDPNAVTKIRMDETKLRPEEEREKNDAVIVVWWVVFASSLVGIGASSTGGWLAFKNASKA